MRIQWFFQRKKLAASCAAIAGLISCGALLLFAAGPVRAASVETAVSAAPVVMGMGQSNDRPDLSCTYHETVPTGRGHSTVRSHEGTCDVPDEDSGTYYCRNNDDRSQVQEQESCGPKVKRYLEWKKTQHKDDE